METVQTVEYSMKVPKEGKEIVDLIDGLLEKAMSGASLSSYAELIDELMVAVSGSTGVVAEGQSPYRDELAGYLVHKVMARLMPVKKPSPPELG